MREARKAYEALMKFYPLTLEDLPGEIWKPVPDWQDYQVSTFGRVKSFRKDEPRIIRPTLSTKGYLQLELHKAGAERTFKVHRLVGTTFIPNPESKPQINHKDGCKINNFVGNLEWATQSQNMRHAYDIELQPSGENRCGAMFTNEQILYIRDNPDGLSVREFAKKFSVEPKRISEIQLGKNYKRVGGIIRDKLETRTPDNIREAIRAEYVYGSKEFGSNALARKYNLGATTIKRIIKERT